MAPKTTSQVPSLRHGFIYRGCRQLRQYRWPVRPGDPVLLPLKPRAKTILDATAAAFSVDVVDMRLLHREPEFRLPARVGWSMLHQHAGHSTSSIAALFRVSEADVDCALEYELFDEMERNDLLRNTVYALERQLARILCQERAA